MSFRIENVPAILTPFDLMTSSSSGISASGINPNTVAAVQAAAGSVGSLANRVVSAAQGVAGNVANAISGGTASGLASAFRSVAGAATGAATGAIQQVAGIAKQFGGGFPSTASASASGSSPFSSSSSGPLGPIIQTGGLVFPYTPTINESLGVKYDQIELVHTNESFHTYKGTENPRITLSECIWTADTFDNALYILAVIHFFRTYQLMDFGRKGSGKPPSPMWFSAYGRFMYNRVPVLLEKVDLPFQNDCDYVGIPDPDTPAYANKQLQTTSQSSGGTFTWIPIEFKIPRITMLVQHSISYWTDEFNLDDFRSGKMVARNASGRAGAGSVGPGAPVNPQLANTIAPNAASPQAAFGPNGTGF